MDGIMQYLIPIAFLMYFYILYIKKPAYMDDKGFPTKRAKENEEIWNYVQRTAGLVCLVMAILLAASAFATKALIVEGNTAYYVQMGIEIVCIALLIPIVNVLTNRKFPKK